MYIQANWFLKLPSRRICRQVLSRLIATGIQGFYAATLMSVVLHRKLFGEGDLPYLNKSQVLCIIILVLFHYYPSHNI